MEKKVYILKISREKNELILVTTNVKIRRNGPSGPDSSNTEKGGGTRAEIEETQKGVTLEVRMLNLRLNMR